MPYLLAVWRAVVLTGALLLVATPAAAQGEAILLLVHGDDLPKERLRDAIAGELKKPVALDAGAGGGGGVVTVTYRASAHELAVTWDGPKRGTVSRVVSAPDKVDDVVRDAAMLAGNLARDEADELLGPKAEEPALPPLPAPSAPASTAAPGVDRPVPPKRDPDDRDYVIGVIYPLGTNFGRPHVKTKFDFNFLSSRIGQLDGFQLGGVNVVAPSPDDAALETTGGVSGAQVAWAMNIVSNDVSGWQVAGLMNSVGGRVRGWQLAPLNLAGDVDGAQVGLVNVGGHVRGATVGFVNVADTIDGVPVGVVSVTKDGGVHPRAWTSTATFANVGLKLATRHTYTMPTGHYHHAYDRDFYGAGFTIGGHIPFKDIERGPYLDTELSFSWLYAPARSTSFVAGARDTYHQHLVQPRLRAILGWRLAEHFSVIAGAGLLTQIRLLRDGEEGIIRVGPEFVVGVEL